MSDKKNAPEQLRGAVVGCGFFAQNHLNAWQNVGGATIVAVCDLDAARTAAAVKKFEDINSAYSSLEEMLVTENLDFIDIVTTMDSHRELVECAASHRVPAIVQKPFAPTMEDARAMVEACQSAGIPLMVHENFRWQTPLAKVGELINSGQIGDPFFARISFRHGDPVGYENQPYLFEQDEYIINDVGIHLFDLARYYMGEVETVYTQTQRVNQRFRGEDVATILLRHNSGATSVVDLSVSTHAAPDPFPQTLVTVEGTQGTIRVDQNYGLTLTRGSDSELLHVPPNRYDWSEDPWTIVQDSVVNIQRHWCECLRGGSEPATSGADNLKSLNLTFLAYESARGRRVVVA